MFYCSPFTICKSNYDHLISSQHGCYKRHKVFYEWVYKYTGIEDIIIYSNIFLIKQRTGSSWRYNIITILDFFLFLVILESVLKNFCLKKGNPQSQIYIWNLLQIKWNDVNIIYYWTMIGNYSHVFYLFHPLP